jgi:hypothetical protein
MRQDSAYGGFNGGERVKLIRDSCNVWIDCSNCVVQMLGPVPKLLKVLGRAILAPTNERRIEPVLESNVVCTVHQFRIVTEFIGPHKFQSSRHLTVARCPFVSARSLGVKQ